MDIFIGILIIFYLLSLIVKKLTDRAESILNNIKLFYVKAQEFLNKKEEHKEIVIKALSKNFFPSLWVMTISIWKNNLRDFAVNKKIFDKIVNE